MTPDRNQGLQEINDILAPLEQQHIGAFANPQYPVTFVVGAPRCGHTLLSQILAASGGFAYISNFVARFWMAPYIGAKLELALGLRNSGADHTFISEYGKTLGLLDPHEFGNFLRRWLDITETHAVEIRQLAQEVRRSFAQEVAALEAVYDKPVLLRNIIYGLNIDLIRQVFPKALFVVCRRDPIYQAQSILIARRKLAQSEDNWWSLRPAEYESLVHLPWWQQIAGQIYHTYQRIERSLAGVEGDKWLEVNYADLCARPHEQVTAIFRAVEGLGGVVSPSLDRIPEEFDSTDVQRVSDEELHRLAKAIEQFFGAGYPAGS